MLWAFLRDLFHPVFGHTVVIKGETYVLVRRLPGNLFLAYRRCTFQAMPAPVVVLTLEAKTEIWSHHEDLCGQHV